MTTLPLFQTGSALVAGPSLWVRLRDAAVKAVRTRAYRVLALAAALAVLNVFDLQFTLLAHEHGMLEEENPVARMMLGHGAAPLAIFKVGLVTLALWPMVRFRHHRIVELGAVIGLLLYLTVTIRWTRCYELYLFTAYHELRLAAAPAPEALLAPPLLPNEVVMP